MSGTHVSIKVQKNQYRLISEGKTAIKVSVPTPHDGRRYRSVGFKKIGKAQAFKIAIEERNRIGKEEWGVFWSRVLSDESLLSRLPRNLEPTLQVRSNNKSLVYEYVANWMSYEHGEPKKVACRYSCKEHGKPGAYLKAKKALLDGYRDQLKFLAFIGKSPVVDLK